ncbi:MAG: hypothetical protein R3F59_02205 [Myxococcota bacterium]
MIVLRAVGEPGRGWLGALLVGAAAAFSVLLALLSVVAWALAPVAAWSVGLTALLWWGTDVRPTVHTVRIRRDRTWLDGAPLLLLVNGRTLVAPGDGTCLLLDESPGDTARLAALLDTAHGWAGARAGTAVDVPDALRKLTED